MNPGNFVAGSDPMPITIKIKCPKGHLIFMADGEGFEPPKVLFHTLSDFKSDAFNRSANHPDLPPYDTIFFQKRK